MGLTDEREEKLKSLGFVWNASTCGIHSTSWDRQYKALCLYNRHYGDCNVPRTYPENPKLSNWVYNNRKEYSRKRRGLKNNLNAEREEKLNAIGFTWILKKQTFLNLRCSDGQDDRSAASLKRGAEWMDFDGCIGASGDKRQVALEPEVRAFI